MSLPDAARALIAQAIGKSAVAYALARNPADLQQVIDAIEREFEIGGFVVLSREELANQVEEGSEEADYEDGQ